MDALTLAKHLAEDHDIDWADDLDADESRRLHDHLHEVSGDRLVGPVSRVVNHDHGADDAEG